MLRLWSDQSQFVVLFYGLNLRSVLGFSFLFLVVGFFFSSVPVTARGLDLFSGAYLNKLSVSVGPSK
jgi:hypothetical protein